MRGSLNGENTEEISDPQAHGDQQLLVEAGFGQFPDGWDVIRMGEILSHERGISVGVMYPGENVPTGVPLIKAGDIKGNAINPAPEFRISHEKHYEYRRTELSGGEILMTLVGDVGQCAVVATDMKGWNAARAIAVIRIADPSDANYVRQCLLSRPLQHLMDVWSNTTVQATLNLKEIRQLPLPWPSKSERDAIARLGAVFDDKIELNRRMNATLEAMARALFQSWFVDFDPVRAKVDGCAPVGTDTESARLFPNEFAESALGPVPRGWKVSRLGDLMELKRGYDLPEAQRRPGSFPIVSSPGPSGWHDEFKVRGPGVVTGRYGTIGRVFLVRHDFWPLNTTLYLKDRRGNDLIYCYYVLRLIDFQKFSDKAAVPGVNRNHLHEEPIVAPPTSVQSRFAELVRPWLDLAAKNDEQSASLGALRDALLPKLLSGELRVSAAEKEVARHV